MGALKFFIKLHSFLYWYIVVFAFEVDMFSLMQNINGMANLKRTQFGKVDLDYVLGIGGFDLERLFYFVVSAIKFSF